MTLDLNALSIRLQGFGHGEGALFRIYPSLLEEHSLGVEGVGQHGNSLLRSQMYYYYGSI